MNPFVQFVKDLSGKLGGGLSSLNQNDPSNMAYLRNLEREMKNENTLDLPFEDLSITVFDLETTGFYPYSGDQILSIGAVKVKGDQIVDTQTFYTLVGTDAVPSNEVAALTGITKEMIEEAPPLRDALKSFYNYVKADVLVAHHANHEKQFMNHATWIALRKRFQHRIVDTAFLTRILQNEQALTTLDECCEHYGIDIKKRHHALYDSLATAELWVACINELKKEGITNLSEIYARIATME
ncbi:exonuclease domain-containing protein [Halobacillus litoralis]|uniref:exonuclease domain-containing protein n=1 Tax=Halobacillus litoralis TaxID=45668 RepID=UPI001CFC88F5|nr:exonuclease domain-containing protein [Halobacillus litoralis]WLR46372.1 exonuclease domain-containing protein [Halobacillus litoralis]